MDADMTYCFSALWNKHSFIMWPSSSACQELKSNKALLAKRDWFQKRYTLKMLYLFIKSWSSICESIEIMVTMVSTSTKSQDVPYKIYVIYTMWMRFLRTSVLKMH